MMDARWKKRKKQTFDMVEVGNIGSPVSRGYDIVNVLAIVVNLAVSILDTFTTVHARFGGVLEGVEVVTVVFFTVDYVLRVWTADLLYPLLTPGRARLRYICSFTGLVDLLCFLPYYMPIFFPAGVVAFRMFRVVRIFRLFRINAYYDSLSVITEVIVSKKQQLFSSVFIILVLMLASSLCMYSLENEAQPEVFSNAFSGIWWAASTLLTVGYGDIYPITTLGKIFGICITFLGVGMVAIPTGIISAGFVEQYSRAKRLGEYADESDVRFIKLRLARSDAWAGKTVRDLALPRGVIVAAIRRGKEVIVPRGDVALQEGDTMVLGAEPLKDDQHIDLQEVVLRDRHPWVGKAIRELDISRQTLIVLVRRKNRAMIPNGDLVLRQGDTVILYSQTRLTEAERLRV